MPDNKKKPKGTSGSSVKNIVSYTSPTYGSTISVDTSGFSSGAKRFNATSSYPSNTLSNKSDKSVTRDFITNRKGASQVISAQQGKTKSPSVPVKKGSYTRPDTPLASTPEPKKII
jgi:hypothetical protein